MSTYFLISFFCFSTSSYLSFSTNIFVIYIFFKSTNENIIIMIIIDRCSNHWLVSYPYSPPSSLDSLYPFTCSSTVTRGSAMWAGLSWRRASWWSESLSLIVFSRRTSVRTVYSTRRSSLIQSSRIWSLYCFWLWCPYWLWTSWCVRNLFYHLRKIHNATLCFVLLFIYFFWVLTKYNEPAFCLYLKMLSGF